MLCNLRLHFRVLLTCLKTTCQTVTPVWTVEVRFIAETRGRGIVVDT